MKAWITTFAVFAVCSSLFAQAAVPECGTTEERQRQVEQLAIWSAARQSQILSKGAQPLGAPIMRDNVVVLMADDTTAPFRRPFDLEGRSLLFIRLDSRRFARQNVDLAYDDMTGAIPKYPNAQGISVYTPKFAFPFFDTTVSQLSLSQANAIFPGAVPTVGSDQLNDAELAAINTAVIAPLWMTPSINPTPSIAVKEFPDRVSISWVTNRASVAYDVQATLFASGDIRFSYRQAHTVPAGAIVITSGREPWRSERTTLVSADDAIGDVTGSPSPSLVPLLDINSLTVSRIAGSNLLEIRMKVSGTRAQLAASDSVIYSVFIGDPSLRQYVSFVVNGSGGGSDSYTLPIWGSNIASPAARMEGDTVIMNVLQDYLVGPMSNVSIRAYSQAGNSPLFADSLSINADLDPAVNNISTDFRDLSSDQAEGPIEEAFTLAVLSVGGVWSEVKQAYGFDDKQWDGVAIYQNFLTDIVLYAGAYSTGGSPAVSGIKLGSTSAPGAARTPNLMHMNAVGYGWNSTTDNSGHLILHEFGHRWLLQIGISENGTINRTINPVSAHPAQYVHTPGAFTVLSSRDASVMGGSNWIDNQNGTFSSPPFTNYSYSWLDLYLMGLADKSEVPPFFYIFGSNPRLGDDYYPPEGTFQGARKNVVMQQVIDAMGPRNPAYPDTQRHFNVLFVLLAEPGRAPLQSEIDSVAAIRRLMETRFAFATGGRADVTTSIASPPGPRRRATR